MMARSVGCAGRWRGQKAGGRRGGWVGEEKPGISESMA